MNEKMGLENLNVDEILQGSGNAVAQNFDLRTSLGKNISVPKF